MIKFFQRVRHQMLTDNRISKYLLYASGEIILVVIGILIALQINNWNEGQKALKVEEELLVSLEKEISNNIEQLDLYKKRNEAGSDDGTQLIQKIADGDETLGEIEIARAFNYSSTIVKSPILDKILESNSNSLIRYKDLIDEMRTVEAAYEEIILSEYYLDELWNTHITSLFVSCGLTFEDSSNTMITMQDLAIGGYSKNQFVSLLSIKSKLHQNWEISRDDAYEKSLELLAFLKNRNQ